MASIRVRDDRYGVPLVELSGRLDESGGAELADKIMRAIYLATESPDHPQPLSLPRACVRAPRQDPHPSPV